MDPITIFLLGGAIGTAAGGAIGWLFGNSAAKEEIAQLQQLVASLVELNRQREAELTALRRTVEQLQSEVAAIKAERGVVARFVRWVIGEHPEIIAKYRKMNECNLTIITTEAEMAADADEVDREIRRLRERFPKEMADWQARL